MMKYNEISKTLLVINVEYFLHVFTFLWEILEILWNLVEMPYG